jgi:structural maintenance of chromosome 4
MTRLNTFLDLIFLASARIQMPPRRSTRSSARSSVEPESIPPPLSKRRRSDADADIDLEDRENLTKPSSRTTRRSSSSKPPPSVPPSRASSRSKSALRQVQQSDDDGEPSHPVKRPRPSRELDDVREEDEEDTKPIIRSRTRGAADRPVALLTKEKASKEQVVAVDGNEEDPEGRAKPSTSHTHSPGTYSNSLKPPTSQRAGRPSRSAAGRVKTEPPDEFTLENNDSSSIGEVEIPASSSQKMARPSSRSVKSLKPPSTENKASGDDPNLGEKAKTVVTGSDEHLEPLAEQSTPVPSPQKLPSTIPLVHEDEKSLLDDLPTSPTKSKRVPPPLEESQGPKSRLVIHKLVLVNFKSYAGRQEIGPFHKVSCFVLIANWN